MKILITGASGFIGKNIREYLQEHSDYKLFYPTRQELNLLNANDVESYIETHDFDFIIHCAIVGGKRTDPDDSNVYEDNYDMFENIISALSEKTKLINFGSGAEDIPDSYYGSCKKYIKNVCDRRIPDKYFHLKIYGCFGKGELQTRFISSCIRSCQTQVPIIIHGNKIMDFVYIKDVMPFIHDIILGNVSTGEHILTYSTKHTLVDIARMVNSALGTSVEIYEQLDTLAMDYYGIAKPWPVKFTLQSAIKDFVESI